LQLISNSIEQTIESAKLFAKELKSGDVVCLYGELGSGKTQFVKGICLALDVTEPVNSPTFIIVNEYYSPKLGKIFHFDLYRMKTASEVHDLGFSDYLNSGSLILIEWPELIDKELKDYKKVFLEHTFVNENERKICW
jgi:tRNA threonylcarbamoyladenosine biosynthesis protein TsaE